MTKIITSQHYLNNEIIDSKIATADYAVLVSPEFEIEGETYVVILDGHHSLAAAIEAGVEPVITTATAREHDAVSCLDAGDPLQFLSVLHRGEGDYIDASTRAYVW